MTPTNSQTIAANIELLQQDADRFIGNLEKELEIARSQRLTEDTQKKLETEIEQARAMYQGLLEPKRKELETARKAEADALKKTTAEIEANAAVVKEKIKKELLTAWIKAGGDLSAFDEAWPSLYQAEMIKRAAGQLGDQSEEQQAKRQQHNVITRSF
jgi:hypothetical protein